MLGLLATTSPAACLAVVGLKLPPPAAAAAAAGAPATFDEGLLADGLRASSAVALGAAGLRFLAVVSDAVSCATPPWSPLCSKLSIRASF